MPEMNYFAIIVSVIAAMIWSSVWYMLLGKEMAKLHNAYAETKQPAWKMLVELVRTFVVVFVLSHLFARFGIDGLAGAVTLTLLLWFAFPAMLLTGAVIWENVPVKLAAIHLADWLVKLILIAVILGIW